MSVNNHLDDYFEQDTFCLTMAAKIMWQLQHPCVDPPTDSRRDRTGTHADNDGSNSDGSDHESDDIMLYPSDRVDDCNDPVYCGGGGDGDDDDDDEQQSVRVRALGLVQCAAVQMGFQPGAGRCSFSKPVRVAVLYQAAALCSKAACSLLRDAYQHSTHDSTRDSTRDGAASTEGSAAPAVLRAVEKCLAVIAQEYMERVRVRCVGETANEALKGSVEEATASGRNDHGRPAAAAPITHGASDIDRIWVCVLGALFSLRECRRLDPFHFKSVYRIADCIRSIGALLPYPPSPQQTSGRVCQSESPAPAWVFQELSMLPVYGDYPATVAESATGCSGLSLGDAAALKELSRLFDKKRPQILAMWSVETPVNPWDKVTNYIAAAHSLLP